MDIIKIGMLGIFGVFLALQFKTERPEYSFYIAIAIGVVIFTLAATRLSEVLGSFAMLTKYIDNGNMYFGILFKVIGITYICEFSQAVCRDAGYLSLAGQIEIFGKISVLLVGMPILLTIIENIMQIAV
ncbi:MAG: stage III sporulation AC/AD family protein [Lachnospiraceae bacterium]|nr:stage III sporulation AC/AD family protein [Lachnospiraceae bacterium]